MRKFDLHKLDFSKARKFDPFLHRYEEDRGTDFSRCKRKVIYRRTLTESLDTIARCQPPGVFFDYLLDETRVSKDRLYKEHKVSQ